jgi:hypothetical protein
MRRSVAAAVWSFFLPPVGVALGVRALRAAGDGPANGPVRAAAWTAIVNGAISCVTWAVIAAGAWWAVGSGWFQRLADELSRLYS